VTLRGEDGRTDPSTRATAVELHEGLDAWSRHHWPSPAFDAGTVNDQLAPLFFAGSCYKTLIWPASFWHKVHEPARYPAAYVSGAPLAVAGSR